MNWFKRNDIDYADVLIGSLAIFLMVLPIVGDDTNVKESKSSLGSYYWIC